jgi:hypothetical protein
MVTIHGNAFWGLCHNASMNEGATPKIWVKANLIGISQLACYPIILGTQETDLNVQYFRIYILASLTNYNENNQGTSTTLYSINP